MSDVALSPVDPTPDEVQYLEDRIYVRPLRNGIPLPLEREDGATRVIQSPVTNRVTGALALQEIFERYE